LFARWPIVNDELLCFFFSTSTVFFAYFQQKKTMAVAERAPGGGGACLLPFPEKFHAARSFVEGLPHGERWSRVEK